MLLVIAANAMVALALGWVYDAFVVATMTAVVMAGSAWLFDRIAPGTLQSRLALATLAICVVVLQIHVTRGLAEAYFGIFLILAFLLVYYDWRPITLAAGIVVVHHVLFGWLQGPREWAYAEAIPDTSRTLVTIGYVMVQAAIECGIAIALRQQASMVTEASMAFMQTLEQAVDSVVVIDADNHVTLFNAAAERLWGYSREEVLGHNVKMLVPHSIQHVHDNFVNANRETGRDRIVGTSREVPVFRKDGTQLWGTMSISKVTLPKGILYTAFIRDVTQQRAHSEQQRLLSTAVHESDIAMIVAGVDQRIVFINTGCTRMFGYERGELLGQFATTVLAGPHTDASSVQKIQDCALKGEGCSLELLTYAKDRRPIWVSATMNPVRDSKGELLHFVGVLTNITQTKMHEVLQYKVLDAVAREVPMLDVMTLICREVERIAPEIVVSILAVDEEDRLRPLAAPSLPEEFSRTVDGLQIGPQVGSCGTAAWRKQPVMVADIANDPLWSDFRDSALKLGLFACWSSPIQSAGGQVLGTIAFYYRAPGLPSALHQQLVDASVHLCALILQRERTKAHIHQLAYYDTLTGLPNRAMLLSQTGRLLHDARQASNSMAVLFIDLDRFKQVNDTRGHVAGDNLLKELANRLQANARDSDVLGRLSGDEFVFILPQCNAKQAGDAAERLLATIARPFPDLGAMLNPSASIGIAIFPEDGADIGTLVRHADLAMYQAKSKAPGSFQFFNAEMNQAAHKRVMLETDLRLALEGNGLLLHYQPQLRDKGTRLYGVEALLRWEHPTLGNVPPQQFVALAEECGLIRQLAGWVLSEACRQMAAWRRNGVDVPHVAINLSASNFQDPALPSLIAGALKNEELAPSDLIVEMTESVMLNPDPVVLDTIIAVHALGVRLSMDDFGTGYSSLSYLHRLPIHELKLDKSFVQDIEHSTAARALTTSVLHIGESLGMTVVAEGVETDGQRNLLNDQACPVLQGYFFSRPLAADSLEQWIADRRDLQ